MRLELILEPRSEVPKSPGFMQHTILNGRRMIVKLEDDDVAPAMQWARNLKDTGVVEEFSVGPSTLEDVYVKMVGNSDISERPEQEKENGTYAS